MLNCPHIKLFMLSGLLLLLLVVAIPGMAFSKIPAEEN